MKRSKLFSILLLFFVIISLKSHAVPYPELIKWRAEPKEFVISLYEGVLNAVPPNQEMLNDLASRINSKPSSRLDLFWLFISSKEYQASIFAKKEKDWDIYYAYVNVENMLKHRYYITKFPSGADMILSGSYTFGVAMSVRDYHATYNEKSLEYGQLTTQVDFDGNWDVDNDDSGNTVTDRAGRTYKTVKIGNQVWMAENLAYEIPGKQINDNTQWGNNSANDGWCYYNNDETTYGSTYGILYQFEAAKMACPAGWHLPSNAEWETLMSYLIANGYIPAGKALAAKSNWNTSTGIQGNDPSGNNSIGFSGLPGGGRHHSRGNFTHIGREGNFWSSSESNVYNASKWSLNNFIGISIARNNFVGKNNGYSVRCIKD